MAYSSSGRSSKNTYFRQLPNLDYPSLANDRTSAYDYDQVKNIFKRAVLREDVIDSYFQFDQYLIEGDDRPDNVANKVYGDSNLDWVVLTTNNVINVRDQWPMSQNDLQNYLTNKYTTAELSYVHHYETLKIVDSSQKLIQPKGLYLTRPSIGQYFTNRKELQAGADAVFEKVKFGKIKIKISKEYSLIDAKKAHEDLEARRLTGPAILIP